MRSDAIVFKCKPKFGVKFPPFTPGPCAVAGLQFADMERDAGSHQLSEYGANFTPRDGNRTGDAASKQRSDFGILTMGNNRS